MESKPLPYTDIQGPPVQWASPEIPDVKPLDWGPDVKPMSGPMEGAPSALSEEELQELALSQWRQGVDKVNRESARNPINRLNRLLEPEKMGSEAEEAFRLTSNGQTYLRGRNNEAVAAANQGTGERYYNDIMRFATTAIGNTLQWGPEWTNNGRTIGKLLKGDFSSFSDLVGYWRGENPDSMIPELNRLIDEQNERYVNFQSDWAKQHPFQNWIPFWGGEGGSDFGGSVSSGLGYVTSALAKTALDTTLAGLLAPETGGASLLTLPGQYLRNLQTATKGLKTLAPLLNYLDDTYKAAGKLVNLGDGNSIASLASKAWDGMEVLGVRMGAKPILHSMLIHTSESSMEGYHAQRELETELIRAYERQHGSRPTGQEFQKIQELSKQAGNATFLLNQAILGVTGSFELGTLLKNFNWAKSIYNSSDDQFYKNVLKDGLIKTVKGKQLDWGLKEGARWYENILPVTKKVLTSNAVLGSVPEGFEESGQKVASEGAKKYYELQYNHPGLSATDTLYKASAHALADAVTPEGILEFMGGLAVGGIASGAKGIYNRVQVATQQQKQLEQIAKYLNENQAVEGVSEAIRQYGQQLVDSRLTGNSAQDKYRQAVGHVSLAMDQGRALLENNVKAYQDARNSSTFHSINPFLRSGQTDILKDRIQVLQETLQKDPDQVKTALGLDSVPTDISKDELQTALSQYQSDVDWAIKSRTVEETRYKNPYKQYLRPETEEQIKQNQLRSAYEHYRDEKLYTQFRIKKALDRRTSLQQELAARVGNPQELDYYLTQEGIQQKIKANQDRLQQLADQRNVLLEEEKAVWDSQEPKETDYKSKTTGKLLKSFAQDKQRHQERKTTALDKLIKQLLDQDQAETIELNELTNQLTEILDGKFDYDELIDLVGKQLNKEQSTGNPLSREETEVLLAKGFDTKLLQQDILSFHEQLDRMTTTKGFESFVDEVGKAEMETVMEEMKRRQAEETERQKEFRKFVLDQFATEDEARGLLGDLKDFSRKYWDRYKKDPEATKQQLLADINQAKSDGDRKAQQARFLERKNNLNLALRNDPEVEAVMKAVDPDGKKLDGLVDRYLTGTETDLNYVELEDFQQVKADYLTLQPPVEPPVSEPVSTPPPPLPENWEQTKQRLMRFLSEQLELQRKDVYADVRTALRKVTTEEEWMNFIQDPTYNEQLTEFNPAWKLTGEQTKQPPVRWPVSPHTGSARGKYLSSGMFLNKGIPFYFSVDRLNELRREKEKAQEAEDIQKVNQLETEIDRRLSEWEPIAQARARVQQNLLEKRPLSDVLNWSILDNQQNQTGARIGRLRDDQLLDRYPASRYLIGTEKESGEAILVIPLDETLRLSGSYQAILQQIPYPALQNVALQTAQEGMLLSDFFVQLGDQARDVYQAILEQNQGLAFRENYEEFQQAVNDFQELKQGIVELIDEHGQLIRGHEQILNRLKLQLSTGSVLFAPKGMGVPIDELAFSTIDGKERVVIQVKDGKAQDVVDSTDKKEKDRLLKLVNQHLDQTKYQLKNGNFIVIQSFTESQNGSFVYLMMQDPSGINQLVNRLQEGKEFNGLKEFKLYAGQPDHVTLTFLVDTFPDTTQIRALRLQALVRDPSGKEVKYKSDKLLLGSMTAFGKLDQQQASQLLEKEINQKLKESFISTDEQNPVKYTLPDPKPAVISLRVPRTEQDVQVRSKAVFGRVDFQYHLGEPVTPTPILGTEIVEPEQPDQLDPEAMTTTNTSLAEQIRATGLTNQKMIDFIVSEPEFVRNGSSTISDPDFNLETGGATVMTFDISKLTPELVEDLNQWDSFDPNLDGRELSDELYTSRPLPSKTTPSTRIPLSRDEVNLKVDELVRKCV